MSKGAAAPTAAPMAAAAHRPTAAAAAAVAKVAAAGTTPQHCSCGNDERPSLQPSLVAACLKCLFHSHRRDAALGVIRPCDTRALLRTAPMGCTYVLHLYINMSYLGKYCSTLTYTSARGRAHASCSRVAFYHPAADTKSPKTPRDGTIGPWACWGTGLQAGRAGATCFTKPRGSTLPLGGVVSHVACTLV